MFNRHSVNLGKELHEEARLLAEKRGYSDVEELLKHLLQRELDQEKAGAEVDEEKLKGRLKGLGYL